MLFALCFLGVRGFVFSRDERQRLCFLLFVFLGMRVLCFLGLRGCVFLLFVLKMRCYVFVFFRMRGCVFSAFCF